MRVLVAMSIRHPKFDSIDHVLDGKTPASGTYGSFIRLAGLLAESGVEVCLSAAHEMVSTHFPCVLHSTIEAQEFDRIIAHQSHWQNNCFTFGNHFLSRTILWAHVKIKHAEVYTFLKEGGLKLVCPSAFHANHYRALPKWREKVSVIYNTYNPVFQPLSEPDLSDPQLLFIGAIAPSKGIQELTEVWSYLAQHKVRLRLAIAGSRQLHGSTDQIQIGSMGFAEDALEKNCILPWLESLPEEYQPRFLGALSPRDLHNELQRTWAVIVNPSWKDPETFCVSAVEAEASNRTVFSLECGGLKETVYRGVFNTLASSHHPSSLSKLILNGLTNPKAVVENGFLAGEYVRHKFNREAIKEAWTQLIFDRDFKNQLLSQPGSPRDVFFELFRALGIGMLFHEFRQSYNRRLMKQYRSFKRKS